MVLTRSEILENYKHGDKFTGVINGYECEGAISFGRSDDHAEDVFFCTNHPTALDGEKAPDRLGYEKSWVHDTRIEELEIFPADGTKNTYSIF